MSSKFAPEALNLCLQDFCKSEVPFTGKTIFFGGDWKHVGPVLNLGTELKLWITLSFGLLCGNLLSATVSQC